MQPRTDSEPTAPRRFWSFAKWLPPALLVLVTLLCYAPSLKGPFFFDDEHFIQRNELVHSLKHIPELYTSTVTQGAAIKGNFYRPNQQLVYTLLYAWVGQSTAVPYHVVCLTCHILCGLLLWFWLRRLGLAELPATLGAALFLLHPVQTEAVSYISGLADPLATAFLLAALLWMTPQVGEHALPEPAPAGRGQRAKPSAPLRLPPRRLAWGRLLAASGCMLLAMFTKENGVVAAPFIVATLVATALMGRRRLSASELILTAIVILLAGLGVVLKLTLFRFGDDFGLTSEHNAYTESLGMRLTTFVSVLWDYAKLLIWPRDLFYEKPYTAYDQLLSGRGLFGLALLLAAAVALARVRQAPRVALAAALILAAFLPFTGVLPLNAMYLEHWLYVPMLGLALLVAMAAERLVPLFKEKRVATYAALTLLIGVGAAAAWRTSRRAGQWADIEAFYLNEIEHTKNAGRMYNNLGMYYADHHQEEKAVHYYQLAAAGETGRLFAQPHHNLAIAYLHVGKMPEAMAELRQALKIDPQFIYSLDVLKQIFVQLGDKRRQDVVEAAMVEVKIRNPYDWVAFDTAVFGR